jgi:hypothetical protein
VHCLRAHPPCEPDKRQGVDRRRRVGPTAPAKATKTWLRPPSPFAAHPAGCIASYPPTLARDVNIFNIFFSDLLIHDRLQELAAHLNKI